MGLGFRLFLGAIVSYMESSKHFQGIVKGFEEEDEGKGMAVDWFDGGMRVAMNSDYSPEKVSSPILKYLNLVK